MFKSVKFSNVKAALENGRNWGLWCFLKWSKQYLLSWLLITQLRVIRKQQLEVPFYGLRAEEMDKSTACNDVILWHMSMTYEQLVCPWKMRSSNSSFDDPPKGLMANKTDGVWITFSENGNMRFLTNWRTKKETEITHQPTAHRMRQLRQTRPVWCEVTASYRKYILRMNWSLMRLPLSVAVMCVLHKCKFEPGIPDAET